MATRLSDRKLRALKHSGGAARIERHYDLHGLILQVTRGNSKVWCQRLTIQGRRRDIGLGSYPSVSLAAARESAFTNRQSARRGENPIASRDLARQPSHRTASAPTFAALTEEVIEIRRAGWRSERTEARWRGGLRDHAATLLDRPIDQITTADVLAVVGPIWNSKRTTAERVIHRIAQTLNLAIAKGYRADNPAGPALRSALPKNARPVEHHKALSHAEVAGALATIHASNAPLAVKLAIELIALTATRSGEVRGARWEEFDLDSCTWTISAERMKSARAHRVPLSDRVLDVLEQARSLSGGTALVLPSSRGKVVHTSILSELVRKLGINGTVHGLRSSFRDWAAENGTAREVAEAVLAHTVKSAKEAAYARTDYLDIRRPLMQAWADYLAR